MTTAVLSAPVVDQTFPAGTEDPGFTYTVTGALADGTPFNLAQTTGTFDLAPGTYTGVVSKLGVSSLPSGATVVTAPATVTLSVPDAGQAATLVVS